MLQVPRHHSANLDVSANRPPTPTNSPHAETFRKGVQSVIQTQKEERETEKRLKRQDTSKWGVSRILVVLISIIAANVALFFGQTSWAIKHSDRDSDGDGIPDHRDMCPSPSQCFGVDCAPAGWLSGRSTDFDSDGCADGSEDPDRDNDGITDEHDSCPETPQDLKFRSMRNKNDFDMDGCMDNTEDIDDDNDLVENHIDACPFTNPGEQSDSEGCAPMQRQKMQTIGAGWDKQDITLPSHPEEPEEEGFQAWLQTFYNVALQVFLGFVLEQVSERVAAWFQSADGGQSPDESVKLSPSNTAEHELEVAVGKEPWTSVQVKYAIRGIWVLIIVLYLQQNKCSLSSMYPWVGYGFEAVGMQCPGLAE